MLKRKMSQRLLDWKRTKTNQGILITGARQVGKTSVVESFGAEHYDAVVKVDFVERPEAVEIISGARSLEDLLVRITALASRPLPEGKSLLFFDEVQRCQNSVTWMRYLAQDGRFDVAYSGSMRGVEAYDFRSLPVGTIDIAEMFPMDFEEFTWATGLDESLWETVRESVTQSTEIPDFLHERMLDLFYRYVLVGGMPDAVQTFVNTSDTQAMRARQRGILDAYRADITRYIDDRAHAQQVKTIYNALPAQLNKENKRFIVSGIDKKRRFADLQPDFDWLENAGVAIPVKRATEAAFPLGLSREDSFFKLYLNDVGLLFSTFTPAEVEAIIARKDSVNFGQAFENAAAQEFRSRGFSDLYYFSTPKVGEVDFLLEGSRTAEVVPVEVKSGKRSDRHAALDALMTVPNYGLERAVVLHTGNAHEKGNVTYLPIYLAGTLAESLR